MQYIKTTAFSPDSKYFACFDSEGKLLIWETLNKVFIDCKYDTNVHSTCTSIEWVLSQNKYPSPKKSKRSQNCLSESPLLAVGTVKGDILLYNVTSKNLYSHLVSRHSDAVNDMCHYRETDSFFTCSDDKSIAIWDIKSGKQKSKWKTGDSPASSICVLDDNNMLSSSTSILWWNIAEKCVIKKFNGHTTEIFKLLPVNAVSLNSCYFLTAAVSDFNINAWSSSNCEIPATSFVLPDQPVDIDVSKISSKDKNLILSTVTRNGFLHLFEHVLNGYLNKPIKPKFSFKICSEISDAAIFSTKLSPESESCIIAYGTSELNMTFKHIKIKESLNQDKIQIDDLNESRSHNMTPVVKEKYKISKGLINGVTSASTSENSPKKARLKDTDVLISNYRRKLRSSSISSLTEPEILISHEAEDSKTSQKNKSRIEVDINDPKSSVDILLRGLHTQNKDAINTIFHKNDAEFVSVTVESLPRNSLKEVLSELNYRLEHQYSPMLSKWIKEILRVHLNYLIQSRDTEETLSQTKRLINSIKISETISRLSVLNGFLNLQIQNSSEDTDSENEEPMQL